MKVWDHRQHFLWWSLRAAVEPNFSAVVGQLGSIASVTVDTIFRFNCPHNIHSTATPATRAGVKRVQCRQKQIFLSSSCFAICRRENVSKNKALDFCAGYLLWVCTVGLFRCRIQAWVSWLVCHGSLRVAQHLHNILYNIPRYSSPLWKIFRICSGYFSIFYLMLSHGLLYTYCPLGIIDPGAVNHNYSSNFQPKFLFPARSVKSLLCIIHV